MKISPLPKIRQAGFGLLEVLVAAVVLAFLLVGLNTMQKGNREAVLRIRSRDAAQVIAQDFLDSLSSLGISSIPTGLIKDPDQQPVTKDYEWNGAKITYTIKGEITVAEESRDISNFANDVHIASKNIALEVSWPFKSSTQSISVSRIVR